LNLRGIRTTARTGEVLVSVMCLTVIYFFVAAIRYVLQLPAVSFTQPFYDPSTFSVGAVSTGASIAVLTYIGFDGIATLSEEAHNPRRNILLAMVLTCAITGLLASAEVYAAQLVWPDYTTYPDADTAFVHVAARAGGPVLFWLLSLTLLVANTGSSLGAQLAAARLLYAMGRDNNLPRSFFGFIESRRGIPRNNVLLTGALTLGGAFLISFQFGAELLNFGAFVGFMGVNAAAFTRYFVRERQHTLTAFLPPVLGFAVCLYIWLSLGPYAKIAGTIWLLAGILYAAYLSRGFRKPIAFSEPPPDQ
jgi:amino acid transporter